MSKEDGITKRTVELQGDCLGKHWLPISWFPKEEMGMMSVLIADGPNVYIAHYESGTDEWVVDLDYDGQAAPVRPTHFMAIPSLPRTPGTRA